MNFIVNMSKGLFSVSCPHPKYIHMCTIDEYQNCLQVTVIHGWKVTNVVQPLDFNRFCSFANVPLASLKYKQDWKGFYYVPHHIKVHIHEILPFLANFMPQMQCGKFILINLCWKLQFWSFLLWNAFILSKTLPQEAWIQKPFPQILAGILGNIYPWLARKSTQTSNFKV